MSLLTNLISAWELSEAGSPRLDFHDSNALTAHFLLGADIATGTGLVYPLAADLEYGNLEYFDCASNATLQTGDIDFTVEAWMKFEAFPSLGIPICKSGGTQGLGDPAESEYGLFAAGGSYFIWRVSNGSAFTDVNATNYGAPPTATWIQALASHDSVNNVLRVRINNGAANTASYSGGIATNSRPLTLGFDGSLGNARYFDGSLGPVRFWKRCLTTQEEGDLWNGGAGLAYASFGGGATKMGFQYYAQRVIGSPF